MDTKFDFNVMESIENIVKFAQDSHLREPFFESVEQDINFLSQYLNVDKTEAVLFSCALTLWFENSTFSNVFNHLGMKEYQILKYRNQIEKLYDKNLLICSDKNRKQINAFEVSQMVLYAVSKNIPLKLPSITKDTTPKTFVDVIEDFDDRSNDFDRNKIQDYEFTSYLDDLYEQYPEMNFFVKVKSLHLSAFELYFLLDTIWNAVNCGNNDFNTDVTSTVDDYCKSKSQSLRNIALVINNQTKLTKLNLIELSKETFRNRTKAKISKTFLKFLKENEEIHLNEFEKENQRLIQNHSIKRKELFYNTNEMSSIGKVKTILAERKFKAFQKRLSEKAMPLGITVLLFGEPGTGKTESVYQLARESERSIFKVDISETKSMWFGESQKLVKKIFEDYREFKEEEKICPILLFNEADGIISKRKASGSSNTSDTENAIQNIILEEMENFDGILFATTNLVDNMDSAFERRFLFKVKFDKPNIENASKIWKSKLPFLNEKEAEELAQRFPYSGGEMENIARKCVMNDLLTNSETTFQNVVEFCKQEKWKEDKKANKIGF